MRTRTVHPGPDADPDPAGSLTGQELVDDLEKVLAEEEAERYPPPGSKEEICNESTKEDWQPCAYQLYRWQMDQEVSHLYALFGGPEEDEVRVKGQSWPRCGWIRPWTASREHGSAWGCDFGECLSSTGRNNVTMIDRLWRVGPVKFRRGPLPDELTVPGGRDPDVSKSFAADWLAVQANQAGTRC
jgi:hypothetical protein